MEVSGIIHAPASLPPGIKPSTLWIGGGVGPEVNLAGFGEQQSVLPLTSIIIWQNFWHFKVPFLLKATKLPLFLWSSV